jgi:glyoxylase-like metal-dependent hydrolase (beta-lactamase superfamily II)
MMAALAVFTVTRRTKSRAPCRPIADGSKSDDMATRCWRHFREVTMIEFTRRSVLAGATAAMAGPLVVPVRAEAAAPPLGRQAPSYYRYKVGSYELTAVLDGVRPTKLGPNATPARNASLQDVQRVLGSMFLPTDSVGIYFHPTVVNTGSKLVLIDTGNGTARQRETGHAYATIVAAGVDPKSIDIVVISHFHGDHIGGLRTADGSLAFPNAEIKVPAKEWAYWTDDGVMSRAPKARLGGFKNVRRIFSGIADKVTRYEWGTEVGPGITAIDTNGHTPGHTSFVVASGAGKVLIQADVTAGFAPLFVQNPDWHAGGDMDGPQAVRTRRKLYDMLAAERMLMSGYHIPFPSLGYIEKAGNGYRFVPVPWSPTL